MELTLHKVQDVIIFMRNKSLIICHVGPLLLSCSDRALWRLSACVPGMFPPGVGVAPHVIIEEFCNALSANIP